MERQKISAPSSGWDQMSKGGRIAFVTIVAALITIVIGIRISTHAHRTDADLRAYFDRAVTKFTTGSNGFGRVIVGDPTVSEIQQEIGPPSSTNGNIMTWADGQYELIASFSDGRLKRLTLRNGNYSESAGTSYGDYQGHF